MNTIIKSTAVAAMALLTLASCNRKNPAAEAIVKYDGPEYQAPSMKEITRDTVFDFSGNKVKSVRVNRFASKPDSNFFIAINIYANEENEAINGNLDKYVNDAMQMFSINSESTDIAIGVDSLSPASVNELISNVDSAVTYFSDVVIPAAVKDSVTGMNLSIDLRPVWANDSYITYAMTADSYLGGAHGNADFYLQTFDKHTGSPMGFYRLIPADRQDEMRQRLLNVIAATDGVSLDQYLAVVNQWIGNDKKESWTVETFPIFHVGLTGQGYVFCYPKYSIAPGSDGCPVYVVPEKEK